MLWRFKGAVRVSGRVEAHNASTAGERPRHHIEACDALYDDAISRLSFLDPTRVDDRERPGRRARRSWWLMLFVAPWPSAERCAAVGAADGGAARELIASGELEALWPRVRAVLTPAVAAAKRAFINRIGSDLDVLCG